MAVSSKEELLAGPVLPRAEVELPSGMCVEVRGVTLDELRRIQDSTEEVWATAYLTVGLVAPELTPEEVAAWVASAPAGDPATAATKIQELSGLLENAAKAAYKSARGRSKS